MPTKTQHGSCHCKAVRFEADIDLSAGTTKCNCTYCGKHRLWSVAASPDAFRPLEGEAALSGYKPGEAGVHGGFCRHCGIYMYYYIPANDWNPLARMSISVAVFDDLDPADLIAAPVTLCDGLHDKWRQTPAEARHL